LVAVVVVVVGFEAEEVEDVLLSEEGFEVVVVASLEEKEGVGFEAVVEGVLEAVVEEVLDYKNNNKEEQIMRKDVDNKQKQERNGPCSKKESPHRRRHLEGGKKGTKQHEANVSKANMNLKNRHTNVGPFLSC
jgi:hypothetical protein